MSLQGRVAAERQAAPGDVEHPTRRLFWLVLIVLMTVPLLAIGGRYVLQVSRQHHAYLAGYARGHSWHTNHYFGDCGYVASKTYRSDTGQQVAFITGCVDGLKGSPAHPWQFSSYHDGRD